MGIGWLPACSLNVGRRPPGPSQRGLLAGSRTALDDTQSTVRAESDGLSQHLYQQKSDWNVVEAVRHMRRINAVYLGQNSEGIILSAYGEDALESIVAAVKARAGDLDCL